MGKDYGLIVLETLGSVERLNSQVGNCDEESPLGDDSPGTFQPSERKSPLIHAIQPDHIWPSIIGAHRKRQEGDLHTPMSILCIDNSLIGPSTVHNTAKSRVLGLSMRRELARIAAPPRNRPPLTR